MWSRALVVAACVLLASACAGSATAGQSSSAPATASEDDPAASSPATTTALSAQVNQTCGDPRAHVYTPDRLKLLAACVTVTGTVRVIRAERDGDLHILLALDSGQDKYLNDKNLSAEDGDLVLEPVCVRAPTQADAIPACTGYQNQLLIPAIGVHVAVTGAWVLDLDHGWQEIHPVFAFNAPAPVATSASPTAATPTPTTAPTAATVSTPTAAPTNTASLCGASANPWNYTFCGGSTISNPPASFCSYFNCISSFSNGAGYVVQCQDGTFSKSGGRTGVCSQHGGFARNLYSP